MLNQWFDLIHQHFNNLKKKKLETNCPRNKYFNELRITLGLKGTDWVFGTNWNFLITISLQPDDVNLWYFKLTLFDLSEFIAWNIKGLRHWVATILKLENQSLWQKLNSFISYGWPNGGGKPWSPWA